MNKQIVNAVRVDDPFNTPNGDLYPHFIELNDGMKGYVFKKAPNAIDVGYEGVFEVKKQAKNGDNILREIKDFVGGGGFNFFLRAAFGLKSSSPDISLTSSESDSGISSGSL